jgi:hypothetical protein
MMRPLERLSENGILPNEASLGLSDLISMVWQGRKPLVFSSSSDALLHRYFLRGQAIGLLQGRVVDSFEYPFLDSSESHGN